MADNDTDRVWELMEKMPLCMLTTWNGSDLHGRPMDARPRRKDNTIYFLTDVRHHKDDEIAKYPKIAIAFSDSGDQKYVSLSGRAEVSNDRAKIKELWEPTAKAWWDSAENPNIRVLKVTPVEAQYWDGPGKVVSMVKMMVAAATGTKPDLGENRKVAMG
jgi:general stress protein 26